MHLLREVEKFLRNCEVAPTRFGREAVGDPRFVFDLRNGREPRPQTVERVLAYLETIRVMWIAMSAAAAGLLRSLLRRTCVDRDRLLLTEFRSTDWQSLTFTGEQHRIRLRVPAPDASEIVVRLVNGVDEDEFTNPGHVVADVTLAGEPERQADGSITLVIEALTVEE